MDPPATRGALKQLAVRWLTDEGTLTRFARGASAALLIGVTSRFVSFPINVVLARVLGTTDFGTYVFVMNWLALFLIVGTLGFTVSLLRIMPAAMSAQEWGLLRGVLRRATQSVLLAASLISVAVAAVVLLRFEQMGERVAYTFLAACIVLPLAAVNVIREASLRALNRIAWSEGLSHLASPIVHAMVILGIFIALGRGVASHTAMALHGLVDLVLLGIGTLVLHHALPSAVRAAVPVYRTRDWVRVSLPLSFVSGMLMLLNSVDVIIVGVMLGPAEAGIYAVAANLARFTVFGLVASNTAAQPIVAQLYSRGDDEGLRRLVAVLVWSSALLAMVVGALLLLLHEPLLRLFGPDFLQGSAVMMILVAGRVINALSGPSGSLLAMTKHQDLNALILGVTVAINVPATAIGVAWWGMEGAALATSGSLALMTVWTWVEVRRRLGVNASVFSGIPRRPRFGE